MAPIADADAKLTYNSTTYRPEQWHHCDDKK